MRLAYLPVLAAVVMGLVGCNCIQTHPGSTMHPLPAPAAEDSAPPATVQDAIILLKNELKGIYLGPTYGANQKFVGCGPKAQPLVLIRSTFDAKITLELAKSHDIQNSISLDKLPIVSFGASGSLTHETKSKTTGTTEFAFHIPTAIASRGTITLSPLGKVVKAAEDGFLNSDHTAAAGPCIQPDKLDLTVAFDITSDNGKTWSLNYWLLTGGQKLEDERDHTGSINFSIKYSDKTPDGIQF